MDRRLVAPAAVEAAPPQEATPPEGGYRARSVPAGERPREARCGDAKPRRPRSLTAPATLDGDRSGAARLGIRVPPRMGEPRGETRFARTSARPSRLLCGETNGHDALRRPIGARRRPPSRISPHHKGTQTEILIR